MGLWQFAGGTNKAEEIGVSSIKPGEKSREQQGRESDQKQDGGLPVFARTLL